MSIKDDTIRRKEAIEIVTECLRRAVPSADDWFPIHCCNPPEQEELIVSVCDDHGDNEYRYTTTAWRLDDCWICDNEVLFGKVEAWKPMPKPYGEK